MLGGVLAVPSPPNHPQPRVGPLSGIGKWLWVPRACRVLQSQLGGLWLSKAHGLGSGSWSELLRLPGPDPPLPAARAMW